MNNFVIMFKVAFKRFFSRKYIGVFLLLLLVSLYVFHMGVQDYKAIDRESRDFRDVESEIYKANRNWEHYAHSGTGIFFIPAPEIVFFVVPVKLSCLIARINTIADLHIQQSRQGESVANRGLAQSLRFSNIVLYFATLLAMLVGYAPMREREYLRQMAGVASPAKMYAALMAAGFFILVLGFFVIVGCMFLLGLFVGFAPSFAIMKTFVPVTFLMLLFFMAAGSLIGYIRTKSTAIIVLLSIWLIFIFVIPVTLDSLAETKTNNIISAKELYSKKLKIVDDFESRVEKESGKFKDNTKEGAIKVIESFWNNEFNKIESIEGDFLQKTGDKINRNKMMALPFITTFYQSVCDEISSNGYTSYLDFYYYLIKLRRDFMRFWIDNVYYKRTNELENFIKGTENLYFAMARLPDNFWAGFLFNALVVIILFFVSFYRFKPSLFAEQEKGRSCANVDIKLEKGKTISIIADYTDFFERFVNVFHGKHKGFDGKIIFDQRNIVNSDSKDFLCLFNQELLPKDMQVGDFLCLYKNALNLTSEETSTLQEAIGKDVLDKHFGELGKTQRANVLLSIAELKKWETYIFDDFFKGLPRSDVSEIAARAEELKSKDTCIIVLALSDAAYMTCDSGYTLGFKDNRYKSIEQKVYKRQEDVV